MHSINPQTEASPAPSSESIESEAQLQALRLTREKRVILLCDVVESVRLMEHDEDNAIARWSQFATAVRSRIAPAHAGSVVKSTGDGLMLEFDAAPSAVAAAHEMHKLAEQGNANLSSERQLHLRIGIHQTEIRRDAHDLYGHGVNLVARIASLGRPNETIITPEICDSLTDQLDGRIEDMGECYFKHVSQPQRVYRIAAAAPVQLPDIDEAVNWSAAVAVIPPRQSVVAPQTACISDFLADGLISKLSRSQGLRVLSRLSTAPLTSFDENLRDVGRRLRVSYIVSGSCMMIANRLIYLPQLVDIKTEQVLWSEKVSCHIEDLMLPESELFSEMAQAILDRIIATEVQRSQTAAVPTLPSYAGLLASISLMHRGGQSSLEKSQALLQALIDRHPRSPMPKAWLAKWHVLKHVQFPGLEAQSSADRALELTRRALDHDEFNTLGLAMQGYVYNHMLGQPELAMEKLSHAISLRPSEPMAWLFRSVIQAMWGQAQEGVTDAQTAIKLSPLDPLSYFFHSIHASSALAAGQLDTAIAAAQESIRLNRLHLPSYRVLLTAQHLTDKDDQALKTLHQLQQYDPGFSLASYQAGGNNASRTRQQTIQALAALETLKFPLGRSPGHSDKN
jgi:adenylate cyclase